jgi:hypothetical protein
MPFSTASRAGWETIFDMPMRGWPAGAARGTETRSKDAARRRSMALIFFTDGLLKVVPLSAEGDVMGLNFDKAEA